MNTNIIGIKSKDDKIYRVVIGTASMYDKEFYVYACDKDNAIDMVADYCEENGFRGLYNVYDELFNSSKEQTNEDRSQIHKLTCCGKNKIFIEVKEAYIMEADSIDDEGPWKCKIYCEFYDVCSRNKKACVKNTFNQLLKTLTPIEAALIRLMYGIECLKEDSIERIMQILDVSSPEYIEERHRFALRKLRHPSRTKKLNSTDMCLVLFSMTETNYSKLWKAIFSREATQEELLEEFQAINRLEIELISRQISFEKHKFLKQENITGETAITECCLGTMSQTLESDMLVSEFIKLEGAQAFEECGYMKRLFAEVVCVLASHGFYFFDYDQESDRNIRAYIKRIYKDCILDASEYFKYTRIEFLDLAVSTFNVLIRAGISTIGDLIDHTEEEIKRVRNMSSRRFDEIVETLDAYNLALKKEDTEYMYECTGESFWSKVLAMPVSDLDLSDHTLLCLENEHVFLMENLLNRSYRDLLNLKDLGKKGADEVVEQLSKLGLCLSE